MIKQPQFRYINETVGGLVLVTVFIFIIAMVQSAYVKKWFDPGETLRVNLPNNDLFGLSEGAIVEILGTKAGEVHKIIIRDDLQMHAEVQLNRVMLPFVRRDSKIFIRKRYGVAGDAYLDISRGFGTNLDWKYAVLNAKADRTPIETVSELIDEVRTRVPPIIDDSHQVIRTVNKLIDEMRSKISPIIDNTRLMSHTLLGIVEKLDGEGNLQSLLANVNSILSNVNSIISNVNSITSKIAQGQGTVGHLLTEDKLALELETLLVQINKDIKRIGPIMKELQVTTHNVSALTANTNKDLPKLTQNVQALLVSLQVILTNLNRTVPQLPQIAKDVGKAMSDTPMLLLQTQQVMIELEHLLKQLQSNWLLGGKAKSQRPSTRISPLEVRP